MYFVAAVAIKRIVGLIAVLLAALVSARAAAQASAATTIETVKASIVAVGTFQRTRQPQFRFAGTGFAVGDGTLVATSAHLIPAGLEAGNDAESLVVVVPARDPLQRVVREARRVAVADAQDLAVLRISGPALPVLSLGDSGRVRDGQEYLFTGFPVGGALGLIPATHRAMVAAVTPMVLPTATSGPLNPRVVRQLRAGSFDVFQLDAMAHPGSSGSPMYDAASGEVIGVVNMTVARTTKEAALPQPTGIAFAVPANHLRELLRGIQ
jgi:S1-C subfamily serine protease